MTTEAAAHNLKELMSNIYQTVDVTERYSAMTAVDSGSTYIHIVNSKLRPDALDQDVEDLLTAWKRMGESIDAIESLWVGRQGPADSPESTVIAVSRFASESDWSHFMGHEAHLEFGKFARTVVEPGGVTITQFHPS